MVCDQAELYLNCSWCPSQRCLLSSKLNLVELHEISAAESVRYHFVKGEVAYFRQSVAEFTCPGDLASIAFV